LINVLVVTRGEHGASIYTDGEEHLIPIYPTDEIIDPTGVGDAFRGGFLTSYSRGWDWELCGRVGALAASYCLEHKGPQSHSYTREEFIKRFRMHFKDEGRLDSLLD